MEYARIRKEESEMETETGMHRDLTQEDLVRMGLNRKGKWQYTVADIEALPEGVRAELIDGELFVIMNTPETVHQKLLGNLFYQIKRYILDREGACEVFPAPFGVCIKDDIHNYVEPDISLICNDDILRRNGCYGPPDLVIEIVSPSNRKMDYVRKLALYRTSGVREYWIVDPRHETVTVYDLEHGKEPVLYPFSERIKVGVYDDLYLDVTAKSAELGKNLQEERMARQAKAHAEGHAEGRAEGLKEGEARLARLTTLLLQEGRTNDLTRALSDLECRDTLYQEYHL